MGAPRIQPSSHSLTQGEGDAPPIEAADLSRWVCGTDRPGSTLIEMRFPCSGSKSLYIYSDILGA